MFRRRRLLSRAWTCVYQSSILLKRADFKTFFVCQPSKLTIELAHTLKAIPEPSTLVFGQVRCDVVFRRCFIPAFLLVYSCAFIQVMTDHMIVMNFDAVSGWSAPVIQPYQPLQLDPASSCFQYCTNVFEGMKVRFMFPSVAVVVQSLNLGETIGVHRT